MLWQSSKCIQLYRMNGQVFRCTEAASSLPVSERISKSIAKFHVTEIRLIPFRIQIEFQFTSSNNLLPRRFCGKLMRNVPR